VIFFVSLIGGHLLTTLPTMATMGCMPAFDLPYDGLDQPDETDKGPDYTGYIGSQIPEEMPDHFGYDNGETLIDDEEPDGGEATLSTEELREQFPAESRASAKDASVHYDRSEVAARDEHRLVRDVDGILSLIREASSEWLSATPALREEIQNLTDDLRDLLGQVVSLVEEIVRAGTRQNPDLAGEAMTVMSAAQDTAADLASEAELYARKGLIGKVARIVKKVSSCAKWLWNIISHLVTPTGWSLSGGINVPGLANAGISITFGNPADA
jgi:hypothetical protein